jgi:hypothetical protein
MEEAGGYFFGYGTRRSKPGLDAPADGERLDCAKDRVGMHAAKFSRAEDLADGPFYYHRSKIQLSKTLTCPYK